MTSNVAKLFSFCQNYSFLLQRLFDALIELTNQSES